MNRPLLLSALVAACVSCVAISARAEVFLLHHGGQIEGQWINRQDAKPDTYEIDMLSGGHITLSAALVEKVVVQSDVLQRYQELLPRVPNTVEGHLDMAERCRKAGLKEQREFHLQKVLELDPNQAEARRGLGYSQVDGKWVRADEWFQNQGYVRHEGGWRLPQEVEIDTRQDRRVVEEKDWRKKLQVWRNAIVRNRNDSRDAVAKLRDVKDPLAIAGLSEMLADPEEPKQLKLLYIDVLSQFSSPSAVAALLKRVMTDPDLEVRERSIDAAKLHGNQQALVILSRLLKDKDNKVVNEAGWALGRLGDPAAVPALIEAVVTKHRYRVQMGGGPGGVSGGFSPQGGGGLQAGGKTVLIEKELQNRQVLTALTSLVPAGVNFAYDKAAWKNWLASLQQNAPGTNLRRDQ
jgi:hypothetical protein